MNRLNNTESVVFLYCRFSLFLKDPGFFSDYLEVFRGGHETGLIDTAPLLEIVVSATKYYAINIRSCIKNSEAICILSISE